MKKLFIAILLAVLPVAVRAATADAGSQWVLVKSTLTYHVSHPLHEVDGVSTAAKGKGVCSNGECDFLVAVPVKSFNSGDSNRDLHMLEVVRGAEFPIVSVRLRLPESDLASAVVHCDLHITFAGQTVEYKQVAFQVTKEGNDRRIAGVIPATVSDFKIPPPKLLLVPIKNEIPIRVDMTWRKQ